jgi:hypothetical protein
LEEKQGYVRIYNEAIASSINNDLLAATPLPSILKGTRKLKEKKEPTEIEKYAVDFALARRQKSLAVNANIVAIALKRKFEEELQIKSIGSISLI